LVSQIINKAQQQKCDKQVHQIECAAVENGDDQHGRNIIDDCKGSDEDFQTEWDFIAQYLDNGQSKSNVCGHWNSPTSGSVRIVIENKKYQNREYNSSQCS